MKQARALWKRLCLWAAHLDGFETEGLRMARIQEAQRLELQAYELTFISIPHCQKKGFKTADLVLQRQRLTDIADALRREAA